MGIALEGEKEIRCEKHDNFNNFFLPDFILYSKIPNISKTATKGKSGGNDVWYVNTKNVCLDSRPFNPLQAAATIVMLSHILINIVRRCFKKTISAGKRFDLLQTSSNDINPLRVFVSFSFSFSLITYLENWINIFVHLLEKTNLLIRSDNKTGFSLSKMLQTNTI
jgi:hypothetical protein